MLSGEIALKNNHYYYKDITLSRLCYYLSESTRGTNTKTMFFNHIYIYIYINPKRRELNRFMLRAVHYIILLRFGIFIASTT